jgi:hypothetical protein
MSVSGGPKIPTQGLVTLVDISNPKCMVSGSSLPVDLANNATIIASSTNPVYTTELGGSVRIAGNGGYRLNYSASRSLNDVSYVAWVYFASGSGYRTIVDNGSNDTVLFGTENSPRGTIMLYGTSPATPTLMPNFQWSHVAVTRNFAESQRVRFYLNGNLIHTGSNAVTATVSQSWISGPDERWTGSINTVAIYNRVLTADEIYDHYNTTRGRIGPL